MLYRLTIFAAGIFGLSFAPTAARADFFSVSGGTCPLVMGGCATATAAPSLEVGDSTGPNTFSFVVSAAGTGDLYQITGLESAMNGPSFTIFHVNLTATYLGNSPTAANDLFVVDVLQNFHSTVGTTWAGNYTEATDVGLDGSLGTGSSFMTNLLYDGYQVGPLGPFYASTSGASTSADLGSGSPAEVAAFMNETLQGDFQFTFDFAQNTLTGAGESAESTTPEPRETLPVLLIAMAGMAAVVRKRRLAAVVVSKEQ